MHLPSGFLYGILQGGLKKGRAEWAMLVALNVVTKKKVVPTLCPLEESMDFIKARKADFKFIKTMKPKKKKEKTFFKPGGGVGPPPKKPPNNLKK